MGRRDPARAEPPRLLLVDRLPQLQLPCPLLRVAPLTAPLTRSSSFSTKPVSASCFIFRFFDSEFHTDAKSVRRKGWWLRMGLATVRYSSIVSPQLAAFA